MAAVGGRATMAAVVGGGSSDGRRRRWLLAAAAMGWVGGRAVTVMVDRLMGGRAVVDGDSGFVGIAPAGMAPWNREKLSVKVYSSVTPKQWNFLKPRLLPCVGF